MNALNDQTLHTHHEAHGTAGWVTHNPSTIPQSTGSAVCLSHHTCTL